MAAPTEGDEAYRREMVRNNKMTETVTRPDGVKLELPEINVSNAMNCSHHVSIDGTPMEVTRAVRYLLADRSRILTLLADVREELEKLR